MLKIPRLMPRTVVAAFKRTKAIPYQGAWLNHFALDHPGTQPQCCGMGVILLDKEGLKFLRELRPQGLNLKIQATLGLSQSYIQGFAVGFDGNTLQFKDDAENVQGFRDGRAAWKAVVKAGL